MAKKRLPTKTRSKKTLAVKTPKTGLEQVIDMVIDGLGSKASRIAYGRAIRDFMRWWHVNGRPGISKGVVEKHKRFLAEECGLAPRSVNLHLAAIRKLVCEAADNELLSGQVAAAVERVKGIPVRGVRKGNWLSKGQAQQLLLAPDTSVLIGKRDQAMLAFLLGAGLRRGEICKLEFSHIQQRESRWVIMDLVGKGNRVRSVPAPSWAKASLDRWIEAAELTEGCLFRSMLSQGTRKDNTIPATDVHRIIQSYGKKLGVPKLSTHDLRRTFAKLAYAGGSSIDQIQLSLGHESIQTTEKYLGIQQDLHDAPCDHLGLKL